MAISLALWNHDLVALQVYSAVQKIASHLKTKNDENQRVMIDIVNLSEMDPRWNWLKESAKGPQPLAWTHVSTQSMGDGKLLSRSQDLRRGWAGWRAASLLPSRSSLLVSHGPRMTMYGSAALGLRHKPRQHLAYSFNFTVLPRGMRHKLMRSAFQSVDRFVCFSTMERELYAKHFDLDIGKIDMIHWAVKPPKIDDNESPMVQGDYVCAIGSQGRDYPTLIQAMELLPNIKFAIVASPDSIRGLRFPGNAEVHCSIPYSQAMNILHHSRFTVVPLAGSEVPCGHVTIVAAMHAAKAIVVTASSGVADYIEDGVTGVTVAPRQSVDLARAIEALWADRDLTLQMAMAAQTFASKYCVEEAVVSYFERYLARSA